MGAMVLSRENTANIFYLFP